MEYRYDINLSIKAVIDETYMYVVEREKKEYMISKALGSPRVRSLSGQRIGSSRFR